MDQKFEDFLEITSSLELGIIPPTFMRESPDAMLSLSEEEQRKAKRKFRKIKRKLAKINPESGKKMIRSVTSWQLREYLLQRSGVDRSENLSER